MRPTATSARGRSRGDERGAERSTAIYLDLVHTSRVGSTSSTCRDVAWKTKMLSRPKRCSDALTTSLALHSRLCSPFAKDLSPASCLCDKSLSTLVNFRKKFFCQNCVCSYVITVRLFHRHLRYHSTNTNISFRRIDNISISLAVYFVSSLREALQRL